MIFLVDAQLPPALVIWLQEQGHSAQHVDEVGLREAEDVDIWNYALSTGASVVTKDEDFAERTTLTSSGPPIIWLRIGKLDQSNTYSLVTSTLAGHFPSSQGGQSFNRSALTSDI